MQKTFGPVIANSRAIDEFCALVSEVSSEKSATLQETVARSILITVVSGCTSATTVDWLQASVNCLEWYNGSRNGYRRQPAA